MPFSIIRQDITRLRVDAIVNAANTALEMGGGVCGAIFKAAGAEVMQQACAPLAPIRIGEAVLTPGFALPAKYVIHAAGPVYRAQSATRSAALLEQTYTRALALASQHGVESIAFPLISGGIYGYPKREALQIAIASIRRFLAEHDMRIILALYDREATAVSRTLLGEIDAFIDEHYVRAHAERRRELLAVERLILRESEEISCPVQGAPKDLSQKLRHLEAPFHLALLQLIDARGKTDVEVYRRANIDRKLFSKIRSGGGYTPSKRTILALAVALELDLDEADALLERAGYALSPSRKFDVIVEYFLTHRRYDIFEINQVLFQYGEPLLGSA